MRQLADLLLERRLETLHLGLGTGQTRTETDDFCGKSAQQSGVDTHSMRPARPVWMSPATQVRVCCRRPLVPTYLVPVGLRHGVHDQWSGD